MSLSRNINPDKVLAQAREHAQKHRNGRPTITEMLGRENPHEVSSHPARDYGTEPIPKYSIPSKGVPAETAYSLVSNELSLDGNPLCVALPAPLRRLSLTVALALFRSLNLASFVHTHMEEHADRLMHEHRMKNLIDSDEYPATTLIHSRLISMLAKLWHADDTKEDATGTATTGSSEAIQLAGLAMKKRWQAKRKAEGKSIHEPGPNIIMGANAQVVRPAPPPSSRCRSKLNTMSAGPRKVCPLLGRRGSHGPRRRVYALRPRPQARDGVC